MTYRGRRKERKQWVKKGSRRIYPPTSIHDVPSDALELVFLRVPTPVCLFRAAATCRLWRRIITRGGFLDRFRSIHGRLRLVLGHYYIRNIDVSKPADVNCRVVYTEFIPCWPLQRRRRPTGTLGFLPRPSGPDAKLLPTDSRGGLLAAVLDVDDVVVCHPLTRRYRVLHPPWTAPNEFLEYFDYCKYSHLGAFLMIGAADDDDTISMSNFRVVCPRLVYDRFGDMITAQAYVYNARDGGWAVSAPPVDDLGMGLDPRAWNFCFRTRTGEIFDPFVGRAGASLFWFGERSELLRFDEGTVGFSTVALPLDTSYRTMQHAAYHHRRNLRVDAGGPGGAVRIFRIVRHSDLEVFTVGHGGAPRLQTRVTLCQLANIKAGSQTTWWLWDTPTHKIMASSNTCGFSIDVERLRMSRWSCPLHASERLLPYELPWRPRQH